MTYLKNVVYEFNWEKIFKMNNIKLLTEEILFELKVIKESSDGNDNVVFLKGIIQKANTKNANGRVYPLGVLRVAIDKYIDEKVLTRSAMGELDHPDRSDIALGNVSHIITKIWWEDDTVYAKIEVLDTPSGNILKKLLERNIKIGISSRATGSVKYNHMTGSDEVADDLDFICWDFVSNPSTPGAFPSAINESVETNVNSKVDINRVNVIFSNIFDELKKWN